MLNNQMANHYQYFHWRKWNWAIYRCQSWRRWYKENDLKNLGIDFFFSWNFMSLFSGNPFTPDGTGVILYCLWHSGQSTVLELFSFLNNPDNPVCWQGKIFDFFIRSRQMGHLISSVMSIVNEVLIVNGWMGDQKMTLIGIWPKGKCPWYEGKWPWYKFH